MVAILPGHSCSGYHTPQERLQACFQQLSLKATWLITSNPTTSDLRSCAHFWHQLTALVTIRLTFRGATCSCRKCWNKYGSVYCNCGYHLFSHVY